MLNRNRRRRRQERVQAGLAEAMAWLKNLRDGEEEGLEREELFP